MIVRRPSRVRRDSGDLPSLPARTDKAPRLLTEWSRRSWVQRQEATPLRPTVDPTLTLSSVVPPPLLSLFPTTAIPSNLPVVTSLTHPHSSSDEPDSPSSSPSIPLETTVVSSNTSLPKPKSVLNGPPPGLAIPTSNVPISTHRTGSSTVLETIPMSPTFTPLPTPTPTSFTLGHFPILPSRMTPTNTEPEVIDDRFGTILGHEATPSAVMKQQASAVTRTWVAGVIVGLVLVVVAGLVLSGVIFYMRRRVSRKSSHRVMDASRTMLNVLSHSTSSHTMGQQESGMIVQGQNPILDCTGAPTRDPGLTAAAVQGSCSQLNRYSQISASSSNPRSIRFAVTGSYRSSTNSYYSQATASMVIDVAHSLSVDLSTEPVSPRSPVSVNTTIDHSASWRGTNLSNIINAARGVRV